MNAFQCDVTYDKLTTHVCEESIDIVTVIFVLSSISPEKMLSALENIATVSVKLLVFFKGDQLSRVPYHSREYILYVLDNYCLSAHYLAHTVFGVKGTPRSNVIRMCEISERRRKNKRRIEQRRVD